MYIYSFHKLARLATSKTRLNTQVNLRLNSQPVTSGTRI